PPRPAETARLTREAARPRPAGLLPPEGVLPRAGLPARATPSGHRADRLLDLAQQLSQTAVCLEETGIELPGPCIRCRHLAPPGDPLTIRSRYIVTVPRGPPARKPGARRPRRRARDGHGPPRLLRTGALLSAAPAPGAARPGWRRWRPPGAATPGPAAAARPGETPGPRSGAPGSPGTLCGPGDGPGRCAARWRPSPLPRAPRRAGPPAPGSRGARPRPGPRPGATPRHGSPGAPAGRCGPPA